MLQLVPGLRIAAPRDAAQLRAQLREAVAVDDAPTVVRFPKGTVGADISAIGRVGGVEVLRATEPAAGMPAADVLLVAVGAMAGCCLDVADRLAAHGVAVTVVDPRWVKPVDAALMRLAAGHSLVVTVEDNGRVGGVGASICQALRDARIRTPVREFGIPQRFFDHGSRAQILAEAGLTPPDIAREIVEEVSGLRTSPERWSKRSPGSTGTPRRRRRAPEATPAAGWSA